MAQQALEPSPVPSPAADARDYIRRGHQKVPAQWPGQQEEEIGYDAAPDAEPVWSDWSRDEEDASATWDAFEAPQNSTLPAEMPFLNATQGEASYEQQSWADFASNAAHANEADPAPEGMRKLRARAPAAQQAASLQPEPAAAARRTRAAAGPPGRLPPRRRRAPGLD